MPAFFSPSLERTLWGACTIEELGYRHSGPTDKSSMAGQQEKATGVPTLVFLEDLWLAFFWIGLEKNLYSPYPLYAAVLQAQLFSHCMGCHVKLPRWKQSILWMGSFVFGGEPAALTPALPPFYLGRDSHWHYRLLQAHLKIIACMIAIFLTSLRRCSLCLGINGCSILDRGKAVSFHVSLKGCIFSTIHFNSARHAVLISRSFSLLQNGEHSEVLLRCAPLL